MTRRPRRPLVALLTGVLAAGLCPARADEKVAPGCPFRNDGTHPKTESKITMGGEPVPHSLFTQPPPKGIATVSYPLGGKFAALRAAVGVPTIEEETDPKSPVTFEVLGDGKSLWKSEPVKARDAFQTCEIPVGKVKTLTLRVHCPDSNEYARAVWFEPVLAE